MVTIQHPNKVHEASCSNAEMIRQNDVAQAVLAGGGSATVAAAVKAAEIKYYRALVASCQANGISYQGFSQALHDLGTGGQ
jgi:hypothetical protein